MIERDMKLIVKITETKDVEEWESYSEDEVHAPVSNKSWTASTAKPNKTSGNSAMSGDSEKTAAAPKKGKKAKPENQKSLFSFFGKK
jgi:hypothetical protein